jgi:hypothetical protein
MPGTPIGELVRDRVAAAQLTLAVHPCGQRVVGGVALRITDSATPYRRRTNLRRDFHTAVDTAMINGLRSGKLALHLN